MAQRPVAMQAAVTAMKGMTVVRHSVHVLSQLAKPGTSLTPPTTDAGQNAASAPSSPSGNDSDNSPVAMPTVHDKDRGQSPVEDADDGPMTSPHKTMTSLRKRQISSSDDESSRDCGELPSHTNTKDEPGQPMEEDCAGDASSDGVIIRSPAHASGLTSDSAGAEEEDSLDSESAQEADEDPMNDEGSVSSEHSEDDEQMCDSSPEHAQPEPWSKDGGCIDLFETHDDTSS